MCWTRKVMRVCCQCNFRIDTKQADDRSKSKMTSKKVIELFYDVVSPYSWLGFEVCSSVVEQNCYNKLSVCYDLQSKSLDVPRVSLRPGNVSIQKCVERRAEATSCLPGWRHARIRCSSGVSVFLFTCFKLKQRFSFCTIFLSRTKLVN